MVLELETEDVSSTVWKTLPDHKQWTSLSTRICFTGKRGGGVRGNLKSAKTFSSADPVAPTSGHSTTSQKAARTITLEQTCAQTSYSGARIPLPSLTDTIW